MVTRNDVIEHFRRDDESLVRGVLHDLCENGPLFATGSGTDAVLRAATEAEIGRIRELREGRIDELLWALVYREGPIERSRLDGLVAVPAERLDAALSRLVADGRVQPHHGPGEVTWVARRFALPLGSPAGWEAGVFDHFRALVRTVTQKLERTTHARADDLVGGSTFTYEIWPGHPHEHEVKGGLERFRREYGALRDKVAAYNTSHAMPEERTRVTMYGGQCLTEEGQVNVELA